MNGQCIHGRNIPWEEFHSVICGEEWWIERVNKMKVSLGETSITSIRDLALMATFNCCWFHTDFPLNILKACEAIGEGKPRAGRSCCQVSPERWQRANEYVAAIQGRLRGCDPRSLAEEGNYDLDNISRVYSMMGERWTSAKEILFRRYLFVLINRLKWATNFHLLGDSSYGDPGLTFRNFEEYHFNDETYYFDLTKDSPPIKELDRRIRRNVTDGEEWIRRLDTPEEPLCQQKYLRYQDIRISSIGCGKWRKALPPSTESKERFLRVMDAFDAALRAWCDGHVMKDSPVYELIALKLGEETSAKKEFVRHFLLQPPGSATHYYWLKDVDRPKLQQRRGY